MTKKELIYVMKRKTLLTEIELNFIVTLVFDSIIKTVKEGESVKIHNFGTFRPSKYTTRKSMKLIPARLVKEFLNF